MAPHHTAVPDSELFDIYEFQQNKSAEIPGYFVISTAPINIDDPRKKPIPQTSIFTVVNNSKPDATAEEMINRITASLISNKAPELIINVHGYNNNFIDVQDRYKEIYQYIKTDISFKKPMGSVFIGYRWPSENLLNLAVRNAFQALPILPRGILTGGVTGTVITAIFLILMNPYWFLPLVIFVIAFSLILALVGLRLTVYFRDTYRATNFGVPDLVELLRQIDQSLFETTLLRQWDAVKAPLVEIGMTEARWCKTDIDERRKIWKTVNQTSKRNVEEANKGIINHKVKLTFIGHSLGCLVVTNTIRILSDVFDPGSIGTLNKFNPEKRPSPEVGNAFSLGRLVLIAPDISVETIIPRRANFLRSALRRFEEAYVFSNEADLALRLASTAANYFSFPAKTRFSGYRLGNITVRHFDKQNQKLSQFPHQGYSPASGIAPPPYGIVNLPLQSSTCDSPYKYLEVRSSDWEHQSLEEIRSLGKVAVDKPVANLFTYFDCTDYKDTPSRPGIVSWALQNPALTLLDYAYLSLTKFGDSHSGYFKGEFSQKVMYQLAFLGFNGLLDCYQQQSDVLARQELLQRFSDECSRKQIQVVLAPERYEVNILGKERDRSGY